MSEKSPPYAFQYRDVATLADTFLPRNRHAQARHVDQILVEKDKEIQRLKLMVSGREAGLERYLEENAELRGYIGRLRAIIADALRPSVHKSAAQHVTALTAAIQRALSLAIPGPGARPLRPVARVVRGRMQFCAGCDRPAACASLRDGQAPCGQNKLLHAEVEP